MSIIMPDDYHARDALMKRRVNCISREAALRQDIRPLRIGILNIMPKAETYEFNLLLPLGRTIIQIKPKWLRLKTHKYKSSDQHHLDNIYTYFDEAVRDESLDGLIITGAPVEEMKFEDVKYWNELVEVMAYARENVVSTLGICWGGLALAKMLGIEKKNTEKKIFGVYETINLAPDHPITGSMDDIFWTPQSRHSGIPNETLELERDRGNVTLLAKAKGADYTIFESTDRKYLMHLGHPEYDKSRLVEEYLRDKDKGREDVDPPLNLDIERPVNRWKSHGYEFFAQWVMYVYENAEF